MSKRNKRIIIYSSRSPGPTQFFDTTDGVFIDETHTMHFINSGDAELKITDIPYAIELRFTSLTFFDSVKLCVIPETEAKKILESGGACLKVLQGDDERQSLENEERLLVGATVASGTAATAASVASIPFVMGFTSTGVAAGSTAAGIQAGIGSVAAGSWFATLQSIAATTLIGTAAPVVAAGAAFAATAACGYALYSHKKSKDNEERFIVYSSKSHETALFFDINDAEFIEKNVAGERLKRSKCLLKLADIPYEIMIDLSTGELWDTVRLRCISKDEADALVRSGAATIIPNKKAGPKKPTNLSSQTTSKSNVPAHPKSTLC